MLLNGARPAATLGCAAATLGRHNLRNQRNVCESRLDRSPDLIIELAWILAGGVDGFADDHANGAGLLEDSAPYPEVGSVMRERHHEFAGFSREQRTAHAVFARLAGHDPRSFGKND